MPANEIVDLAPGELFVHRNVANVVVHTDLNCLSVLQYAVDVLKVEHVIVVGHYGCGGIKAALEDSAHGLIDNWLRHVQDVAVAPPRADRLARARRRRRRVDRLCELNVIEQVANVARTTIVQDAWARGQPVTLHGLVYGLADGLLRDLGIEADSLARPRTRLRRGDRPIPCPCPDRAIAPTPFLLPMPLLAMTTIRSCSEAPSPPWLAARDAGRSPAPRPPRTTRRGRCTIIVPFSPGGAVDGPTRIVAQKLGERLGQQVVVENKPGAGATLGAGEVAKAAPDGYTLLLASQTNAISASLYRKLPFDPIEDFAPVMLIGEEPGVLVVHPSFPAKTLDEFIAYVRDESRQGRLRVVGQRQRPAPVRRDARLDGRPADEPHPVQGERAGDRRPARRAGAGLDPGHRRHDGTHQGRQAPSARDDGREARRVAARAAGDRRALARATWPTSGWACWPRRARRSRSSTGCTASSPP